MLNTLSCDLNLFCGPNYDLLFLVLVPFLFIVITNEIFDKYTDMPREIHRKYGHILSGLLIIFASYHLGYVEMILFSIALMLGAIGTRVLRFKTVHEVTRKSIGTFLFAFVTLILTLLWFENNPELLRYGIWILTVPDALAALIGSKWGKQSPRYQKSFLGSTVFFTFLIIVTAFFTTNLLAIAFIAVSMTVMEYYTRWGIDNLTLPLLGSILLFLFL